MPTAKKGTGAAAAEDVIGSTGARDKFLRPRTGRRAPLPWPIAGLTIVLLSLLLWAAIVAIVLFAFD